MEVGMFPSGTITFLFTDIEGSTKMWEQHPTAMGAALARHDQIMEAAIREYGGHVVKKRGDGYHAAFGTPQEAVSACIKAQHELCSEEWGEAPGEIKVRMSLHTAAAKEREGDYYGTQLNRAARLVSAGHGEQVLLSRATYELLRDDLPAGVALHDLGKHRLKDLSRQERIYQLIAPGLAVEFPPLSSLDNHPHNLPLQLTTFVGREKEIAEITNLLATDRLVTLVGPGGVGKSRLALQVGAELIGEIAQGVWFVDLAPLAESELVPQAVASVLNVREEGKRSLEETLADYLNDKTLLLILDNCEHQIDSCAQLADSLLRVCSGLRILITSREALRISGEMTRPVLPLDTPDSQHLPVLEKLSQYDAVRLFIDRAVAVSPTFAVDNANAPAVAQICHSLDGIPLAIELAAARVRAMSVEMIATRLDDRFRLLSAGERLVRQRHQTLEAVIDWSYDLLREYERNLFRRLGVFAGGWTLEAAEAVCCGKGIEECEILYLLTSLVDKSLVQIDRPREEVRYRMLETVRQYAWEKAFSTNEVEGVRARYIDYYLKLAEEGEEKSYWGGDRALPKQLSVDLDNFRAALTWCLEQGESYGETVLRLTGALWIVWWTFGYLNEGRDWLERAIKQSPTEGAARAKALNNLGCIAWQQGDYHIAAGYTGESISIYRAQVPEDRWGLANAIHIHGHVLFDQKDYSQARALFEESLLIFRQLDDQVNICTLVSDIGKVDYHEGNYQSAKEKHEECLAIARNMDDQTLIAANLLRLGDIARLEGDYQQASDLYEESLEILGEMEFNLELAGNLHKLGYIAQYRGEYLKAAGLFVKSLSMQRDMGNKQGIAECLAGLASVAVVTGELETGVRLFAATEKFLTDLGAPLGPADRAEMERDLSVARVQLSEDAYSIAWTRGTDMTLESAIASAENLATSSIDNI
jgi:predicted ATPase/class 3 adenylate cyclase